MVFHYFSFEGRFKEPDPEFGCIGVCTSCLVPEESHQKATMLFREALDFKGVIFLRMLEEFLVNDDLLDPEDEEHAEWIELCAFTKERSTVVFNEMNVFDPE